MAIDPRNHPYLFPPITVVPNGKLAPPDTARDKNAAAKALMDLGWTFEEVAAVLGYKVVDKESDA